MCADDFDFKLWNNLLYIFFKCNYSYILKKGVHFRCEKNKIPDGKQFVLFRAGQGFILQNISCSTFIIKNS